MLIFVGIHLRVFVRPLCFFVNPFVKLLVIVESDYGPVDVPNLGNHVKSFVFALIVLCISFYCILYLWTYIFSLFIGLHLWEFCPIFLNNWYQSSRLILGVNHGW